MKPIKPIRIQLSRKKGWRLPKNTVVVSRPSKWGNAFIVGRDGTQAACVELYKKMLAGYLCLTVKATPAAQNEALMHVVLHLGELRGKNLACWCKIVDTDGNYVPCHADILLSLANGMTQDEVRNENLKTHEGRQK